MLFTVEKADKEYRDGRIGTIVDWHRSMMYAREHANKIAGYVVSFGDRGVEKAILEKLNNCDTLPCLRHSTMRIIYDAERYLDGYGERLVRIGSEYR